MPPRRWRSVLFVIKAIEIRLRFIAVLVVIGLVIGYWDTIRNYWDKWTRPAASETQAASGEEFYCPMHPTVIRDELDPDGTVPECPICGMPLSKRKKGAAAELPEGVLARVQFSPERIQQAGIDTAAVAYRPLVRDIRTVGFVDYAESRMSQSVSRVDGFVERLFVDETFQTVERNEPLAEIYSPELYAAAQAYLIARRNNSRLLLDSTREKLRLLGVSDEEIGQFDQQDAVEPVLVIRSKQQGHVIRKNVVDGSRIETGMTLFEVADLSVVWIEAEVYEHDVRFLKQGQAVEATVVAYPDRALSGRVGLVHPHVETATRTNRVRFELDNPTGDLRPGMYATVQIKIPLAETEPFAGRTAKRKERPADGDLAALAAWQQKCPVTGLKLGSMGPPVDVAVASQTVLLCCKGCVDRIEDAPETYLTRMAPPPDDAVLTVPLLSVIDTGTRKIVYVEREPGQFDGVEVTLGPRVGEFYPVISGLLPDDRVAARGAFLIDAETRLNPAAAGTYFGASGSGGGGHSHGTMRSRTGQQSSGEGLGSPPGHDHSREHKPSAEELKQITKLPAADQKPALAQQVCPITGEPLGSMGMPFKVSLEGQDVFLCCRGCESKAKADPQATAKKAAREKMTNHQ